MIDTETQRETATKAVQTIADSTTDFAVKAKDLGMSSAKTATESASDYMGIAMELGGSAADSATDLLKTVVERAQTLTGRSLDKISEVSVGDKNVGERFQATVETVEEKIDVDQIQDQVAKMRDQMEKVLGSWKDSFRPSTTVTDAPVPTTPAKKAAPKKPTTKASTTTKKAPVKKAAPKKTTTKASTATKKAPAKKTAAKK